MKNSAASIITAAKISAPVEVPSAEDWTATENELGLRLPSDFKELVSGLGSGHFGDCLNPRNPRATEASNRLDRQALAQFAKEMDFYRTDFFRDGFYPEPGGVISIGSAAAAVHLFYQTTRSPAKVGKLILLHADLFDCVVEERSISELLWDAYGNIEDPANAVTRSFRHTLWPPGENNPLFTSHP